MDLNKNKYSYQEAYDSTLDLNSVIAVNPSALDDARKLDRERAEGIGFGSVCYIRDGVCAGSERNG